MATDEEPTVDHLDVLAAAVQTFVNSQVEKPTLVDQAIVIWEQVSYDEDGNTCRQLRYSIPTDNFSLSGALGLLEASREYVRRDALGVRPTDDD